MTISAPSPNGILFSWIDTGLLGANKHKQPSGNTATTAEDYQTFRDWVIDTRSAAVALDGTTFNFSLSTGLVTFDPGASGNYVFDRTGALMGITNLAGANYATDGSSETSNFIPAGAIWLMGAELEEVALVRELKFETFRWKRGYGYTWGGARLYRWKLTMHKEALDSFELGWAATGKVTIQMSSASDMAFTGTGYTGKLTGYVVGVESSNWLGPAADIAEINLVVAGSD